MSMRDSLHTSGIRLPGVRLNRYYVCLSVTRLSPSAGESPDKAVPTQLDLLRLHNLPPPIVVCFVGVQAYTLAAVARLESVLHSWEQYPSGCAGVSGMSYNPIAVQKCRSATPHGCASASAQFSTRGTSTAPRRPRTTPATAPPASPRRSARGCYPPSRARTARGSAAPPRPSPSFRHHQSLRLIRRVRVQQHPVRER